MRAARFRKRNMELIHQITSDEGPKLVLQGADTGVLPVAMPMTSSARVLKGDFADFALVRPFVRALLAYKPQSLVVDHLCSASADLVRFALALGIRVIVKAGLEEVQIGDQPADRRWGEALIKALRHSIANESGAAWSEIGSGY